MNVTHPLSSYAPLAEPAPADLPRPGADPREAAAAFEKLLVRQLLEELPLFGELEDSPAGMFSSLVHDALSEQLTAGGGLGLAEPFERALAGNTAGKATLAPFHARPHRHGVGVTSGYGFRADPIDGDRRFHAGIDLAAEVGANVRSAGAGVVTFAGPAGGYGQLVVVDHGDGLETRYAHCSELVAEVGQRIGDGDVIAKAGATGRTTGAHLHFEVRRHGDPVDPTPWVDRPQLLVDPIRQEDHRALPAQEGRP